jgi:hypothetical protein
VLNGIGVILSMCACSQQLIRYTQWGPRTPRWRRLRQQQPVARDLLCWRLQVLADQTSNLLPTPPKFLPSIYRNEYLLDGHVDLQTLPVSDVYNGNPKPLAWSQVQAALYIHAAFCGSSANAA